MDKKTIIKTGSLLLPAAVVAASCGFSILLHQPDIAQSDNINESALAAEISADSKQSSVLEKDVSGNTVQESVKPENMPNESAQNSAAASETSKHISGQTNKKIIFLLRKTITCKSLKQADQVPHLLIRLSFLRQHKTPPHNQHLKLQTHQVVYQ